MKNKYIQFFKKQSKNLYKSYKYRIRYLDNGLMLEDLNEKYFDINKSIIDYEADILEDASFSLMKAQHIIAEISGFNSWKELINSSEKALLLGKILFENRDKIAIYDCFYYISEASMGEVSSYLDDDAKLCLINKFLSNSEHQENCEYIEIV